MLSKGGERSSQKVRVQSDYLTVQQADILRNIMLAAVVFGTLCIVSALWIQGTGNLLHYAMQPLKAQNKTGNLNRLSTVRFCLLFLVKIVKTACFL